MAESARSVIEFEAGGVKRAIRPTFAAIDAIEGAVAKSVSQKELQVHGTGLALLVGELRLPAPRLGLVARCAVAMLAHAEPPLTEPESQDVVFNAGLASWLIDPDHPKSWGPLVVFTQLAQYGPQTLQRFLDEDAAEADSDEAKADGSKKKSPSPGQSWFTRLCKRRST